LVPSAAAAVANFLGRAEGARRACLQDAHLQDGRLAARSCAAQGTARNSPLDMTIETAMGTNPSRNGHAVVCVLIGRAAEFAALPPGGPSSQVFSRICQPCVPCRDGP